MAILAIDQGTTSTRALLVTEHKAPYIVHSVAHQQFYPQPGWVEHSPKELIDNIRHCIDAAPSTQSIAIANQGESCLAWNAKTGEAICEVIVWQDNRTYDRVEALKLTPAKSIIEQKTGLPLDSYFSASKLAWIVENIPEAKHLLAQGDLRLGTSDAYFLDILCQRFVTDVTTASRTSLMNLQTGQWDPQLCELFAVPIDALPEIVPSSDLKAQVKAHDREIPVIASLVDQQASIYGHQCRQEGDAKITFGTGAFAMVLTGEHYHYAPHKGLLPTVAWQHSKQKPVYALDGGVHCASSAVNWGKKLGLFKDFTEINHFDEPAAITRNLVFVPALTGLACPHWDRSAAGLWIGLSLATSPSDMMQAMLEGIAFRAAQVLQAMGDFAPLQGISIDGGMSQNPYFCQFLADVLQCTIKVPQFSEMTALGAAMFARDAQIISVNNAKCHNVEGEKGGELSLGEVATYHPNQDMSVYLDKFSDAVERSKSWNS